ncbi:CheY-like chemotaxis protein [Saonia flava]|uniref:CheY-like chemotaxis protein n=1 Tax=Saonia flava TaxID=523696 RepID=A0A846QYD8_9FLAO|nr:response regulator [Saonia flava]NJB71233.1 CheY-like chemotaxis protein [Saonia flava]
MTIENVKNCCIIDDDPIFIYGTKRLMKEIEFCENFLIFNNGKEAIEGLVNDNKNEGELPCLILLDLNMPVLNGWDFLEAISKIKDKNITKIPIFIITSSIDPRDLEKVKNYAFVHGYLTKPITSEALDGIKNTLDL